MTDAIARWRNWLALTKPGIVLGNLMAVAGGFLLAARGVPDGGAFGLTMAGAALLIAGSGACNNCIDRDIDAKMLRTRLRPLVTGAVHWRAALWFGGALSLGGLVLLSLAHPRAAVMGAVGWLLYVGLYSLLLKRRSVHGTLFGSLSGAIPPVIGYCALRPFDGGAALLMAMFCLWQIPHSYAIALMRADDYAAASIPQFPLIMGAPWLRRHFAYYIIAFTLVAAMLSMSGYTGAGFLMVALGCGAYWLILAASEGPDHVWARHQFRCSLVTIIALSLAMAVDFS